MVGGKSKLENDESTKSYVITM